MRVVIVGATGNVGTSVIEALSREDRVTWITGVARRLASIELPKTTWAAADITRDDLVPIFKGADAVVHLAWAIQPSHNAQILRKINITGSERLFRALADSGVKNLIYASSVGAYSPGPKDRLVSESWPVKGVPSSFYSRHKAQVEAMLDSFQKEHPEIRVVRLRKALIFKAGAASEVRRLFLGPFFPAFLANPKFIPLFPDIKGVRTQVVHSLDAGEAYRLAITSDVAGPFNIAGEPVIDPERIARLLGSRPVTVSASAVRFGALATWKLRLQPTPPGWLDLGLQSPLMDPARARTELGWKPRFSAEQAVLELLEGISRSAGIDTPPLSPWAGGPLRIRELKTGAGQRQ